MHWWLCDCDHQRDLQVRKVPPRHCSRSDKTVVLTTREVFKQRRVLVRKASTVPTRWCALLFLAPSCVPPLQQNFSPSVFICNWIKKGESRHLIFFFFDFSFFCFPLMRTSNKNEASTLKLSNIKSSHTHCYCGSPYSAAPGCNCFASSVGCDGSEVRRTESPSQEDNSPKVSTSVAAQDLCADRTPENVHANYSSRQVSLSVCGERGGG